jgi:hypothetical protein
MTHNEIAETILDQMGGAGKLYAMIGAQHMVSLDDLGGVQFVFKGSKRTNKVVIKLNSLDLYDIEFWKFTKSTGACVKVTELCSLYADQLVQTFSEETGLYLTL